MIKFVPRGNSAAADAYLTPCIKKYLDGFFSGFDEGIIQHDDPKLNKVRIEFMQSDGGLAQVSDFNGFRAILSGPAAGVVGYAMTSWSQGGKAIIGFDMG
jgi:5-oxoprolinase (ATP-hydrolysing)